MENQKLINIQTMSTGLKFSKVLLIEPPRWKGYPMMRGDRCSRPAIYGGIPYSYWLGSTAGYLRDKGITISVLDTNALDSSWEAIEQRIRDFQPEVVFMTGGNCSIDQDAQVAEIAKKVNSKILTVLYEPTLGPNKPKKMLNLLKGVDMFLSGEPENIMHQICQKGYDANGIIFRADNEQGFIRRKADSFDIKELKMPAYDLLPMQLYDTIYVRYNRGCPYLCTFCTIGSNGSESALNKSLRFRDEDILMEELKYLKSLGKRIEFADETFTVHKKKVVDLCNRIIREKLNIKFDVQTRVDCVDEEVLTAMKNAGCSSVAYGIESGNQEILDATKKGLTVEQLRTAFKLTKKIGITVLAFNIVGLKGENKQTIQDTINLNKELLPDMLQFATATPMIGTEFWKFIMDNKYNVVGEDEVDRIVVGTRPIIEYPDLKGEEMLSAVKNGLIEINWAYMKEFPKDAPLAKKAKFIAKRLLLTYQLMILPKKEFPGKAFISR